jgi:hypothetical protein
MSFTGLSEQKPDAAPVDQIDHAFPSSWLDEQHESRGSVAFRLSL